MGTYEDLKAAIQQVIRTNGNNEITGALLQQTLLSIVNSVGANATFAGIATPNTNPGTADQNVFYLATEAGTYVNFGGINIQDGQAAILSNKTNSWIKEPIGLVTYQEGKKLNFLLTQKRNISLGDNLVNPQGLQANTAIRATGEIVTGLAAHYAISEYILIDSNNIISNGWRDNTQAWATYAVYDENFNLIRTIVNNSLYTYQTGDVYIRISFQDNLTTAMANYGNQLLDYIPYTQNYDFEQFKNEINNTLNEFDNRILNNKTNIDSLTLNQYSYDDLYVGYYSNDGSFVNSDTYRHIRLNTNNLRGVKSIYLELLFPAVVSAIQFRDSSGQLIGGYNTEGADILYKKEIEASEWENAAYIIIQTYSYNISAYDFILYLKYENITYLIKSLRVPCNIIEVGKGMFYNDVQSAIDSIIDDSQNNPYLIVVYPGNYAPFRIASNRARYISIIGLDKFSTKIICTSGKYADATTIMHTFGVIRNLTFIANFEDFNSVEDYVTWINTQGNNGAYALHIDGSLNTISQNLIVENCILISECNATIGIGLHQDEVLQIQDCDIEYRGNSQVSARFNRGAFYCHSYPVSSTEGQVVTNQNLKLINNRFSAKNNGDLRPLYLAEIEYMSNNQGGCNFEFFNNIFIPNGVDRDKQVNLKVTYGTNPFSYYINDASIGNNISTMNKPPFDM